MNQTEKFTKLIKDRWYIQSGNATPIHLMSAALSGFSLESKIGLGYTQYIYEFENDFGKMYYYFPDLEKMSDEILLGLAKNNNYFIELKKKYDKEQKISHGYFKEIDSQNLNVKSNHELFNLIKKGIEAIEIAVGIGHIIESYALITDESLKTELGGIIKNSVELNEAFIALTTPTEPSFAQESERLLKHIAKSSNKKKEAEEYIKKFYWIKNTYSARHILTIDEVISEADAVKDNKEPNIQKIKDRRNSLYEKLNLDHDLKVRFDSLLFITTWQDERKKNVLIAVDYLERLLEELSLRTKIGIELLRYALGNEFNEKIAALKDKLAERRNRSLFFHFPDSVTAVSGEDYKLIKASVDKKDNGDMKQLSGNAASLGTAIGRVKVCTTVASLSKVNEGDILVASMTRPEYLPAMKKAAAFVTDEGGITCHAAIVAREMGKPCIIGTKIATQVLTDNDTVEVKGNHGVVVIMERAK